MMAVHDPDDSDDDDAHPLLAAMRIAIDAAINSDDVDGADIALDLCVALLCCGTFGSNVKLLAEIDDMMTGSDETEAGVLQ